VNMKSRGHSLPIASRLARWRRIKQIFQLGIIVIAFFSGVIYLLTNDRFNIKLFYVQYDDKVVVASIEKIISENLKGKYAGILPRANIFTYPKSAIASAINAYSPKIDQVKMNASFSGDLRVSVTELAQKYVWCGASGCSFMNPADGALFSTVGSSIDQYLIFSGQINKEIFLSVLHFVQKLMDLGINVKKVEYLSEREQEVRVHTKDGWYLLYNLNTEFDKIDALTERVRLALSSSVFVEKNVGDLEYLDMRFGNRVFYKFK